MIELRDIWFSYGDREILKGVNMKLERGEVAVLLGRNGAGKSTLLMHLNGLLKPKKGEVIVDGNRVRYDRKSLIQLRRAVGFVFQNPDDQIVAPTVWQDVVFGPENLGTRDDMKIRKILMDLGLKGYDNRLCNSLSGGEKKRVGIAGVLAMEPDYVIMDEPTAGVDGVGLREIVGIVWNLKESGKGVLISTHDLDFAKTVGDRFMILDDGRIIHDDDFVDYSLAEKCGIRTWMSEGEVVLVSHDLLMPEIDYFDFVAVMGRSARERLEKEGIEPDINTAGMERAFLRAIGGARVMLVCSRSMIDVVKREAQIYPVRLTLHGGVESYERQGIHCWSRSGRSRTHYDERIEGN